MVLVFWPTVLAPVPIVSPSKEQKEERTVNKDVEAKNGFVIGWECSLFAPCSRIDTSTSTSTTRGHEKENNNNTTRVAVPTSKGIVCAGIITVDNNGGTDSCNDYLNSFQKIQNSIQALKSFNKASISGSNGHANDYSDHKNSTSFDTEKTECQHANNIIIQELKVVAKWTDCGIIQGQSEGYEGRDEEQKCSTQETASCSHEHHRQQQTAFCHLPLIVTESLSIRSIQLPGGDEQNVNKDLAPLQLILFKPCPLQSFDYYHHSFDTSYHSLFVNESNNTGSKILSTLLMRLSETESVMDRFNHCLNNQKSEANARKEIILDPQVYNALGINSNASDLKNRIRLRKTKEVSFLHKILLSGIISSSLTAIHLKKNKSRYYKTKSRLISRCLIAHSPILYLIFSYCGGTRYLDKNNFYVPRRYLSKERLTQDRLKFDSMTDSILGLICGLAVIKKHTCISSFLERLWNGIHGRLLCDNIGWLETFPAGFKLNVPLTKVMGRAALWLTRSHEDFLRSIFTVTDDCNKNMSRLFITMMGVVCITFGFKLSCAIIFDLARVITLHISMLARVFQRIYQMQLSLFSSLWHLFRGKKKNVLRKRSDTLEFDFMQLLLGMILFTICLFIFTTIFVYYMFFTCVQLTVVFYAMSLWSLYLILDKLPVGDIVAAAVSPGRFRKDVHFVNLSKNRLETEVSAKFVTTEEENPVEVTENTYEMVPSNLSPAAIAGQVLGRCVTQFLKKIPSFISETLSGESSSVIKTGLQMI